SLMNAAPDPYVGPETQRRAVGSRWHGTQACGFAFLARWACGRAHCGRPSRLPSCSDAASGSVASARHEENERAIASCAHAPAPALGDRGDLAVRDPSDPAQSAAESGLLAPIIARSPWYLQIPLDAFAHFLASDGWAIASYIAFAILAAMFPFLI